MMYVLLNDDGFITALVKGEKGLNIENMIAEYVGPRNKGEWIKLWKERINKTKSIEEFCKLNELELIEYQEFGIYPLYPRSQ